LAVLRESPHDCLPNVGLLAEMASRVEPYLPPLRSRRHTARDSRSVPSRLPPAGLARTLCPRLEHVEVARCKVKEHRKQSLTAELAGGTYCALLR